MEATTISKIIETSLIAVVLILVYCGVMKAAKKVVERNEEEQKAKQLEKTAQAQRMRQIMDKSIEEARAAKAAKDAAKGKK